MKLIIFLFSFTMFSIQGQSLTFDTPSTLLTLEATNWSLSQPIIDAVSSDGKYVGFYGLTGSTYKKYVQTAAGSYPSKTFQLYGDFNYITGVHDFDGDGMDDILTDADIFRSTGDLVYERFPVGNIRYEIGGSLDYDGDRMQNILITENDFNSGKTSLNVFRNITHRFIIH